MELIFVVCVIGFAFTTTIAGVFFYLWQREQKRADGLAWELKVEKAISEERARKLASYRNGTIKALAMVAIHAIGVTSFAEDGHIETLSDGVAVAVLDARGLVADIARYTRYIHYLGFKPNELPKARKVIANHVNALSIGGNQAKPRRVSEYVDAIYLPNYVPPFDYKALKSIVDTFGDFKVARVQDNELKTDVCDQYYHVYEIVYDKKGNKTFVPHGAPWLGPSLIDELNKLTYSNTPIIRADWYFNQTAIQANRDGHGYYDWFGGKLDKSVQSFFNLIGIDEKKEEQLRLQQAEVMGKSGVAFNNRRIRLGAAITGYHFVTDDFINSVGRRNVIRNLDKTTNPLKGDANEHFGLLPNGQFINFLNNIDGVRQDFVPQTIAMDDVPTASLERNIHCYFNCVACHKEGLRPIDGFIRGVVRDKIHLGSFNQDEFQNINDLYFRDLKFEMRLALIRYNKAVQEMTGWSTEQLAEGYRWMWNHQDQGVSLEQAALEFGVPADIFLSRLRTINSQPSSQIDPIWLSYLASPPVPMSRAHFDEQFLVGSTYVMPREGLIPIEKYWQPPKRIPGNVLPPLQGVKP